MDRRSSTVSSVGASRRGPFSLPCGPLGALEKAQVKALWSLWLSAWNLGLTSSKSEEALMVFVRDCLTMGPSFFRLDSRTARKVIVALRTLLSRPRSHGGGGVDFGHSSYFGTSDAALSRWQIMEAQWRALGEPCIFGVRGSDESLGSYAYYHGLVSRRCSARRFDRSEAIVVMDHLGFRIRSLGTFGPSSGCGSVLPPFSVVR